MNFVNHIGVRGAPVAMAFPQVWMICWKVILMMLDDVRIGGRPEHQRDDCSQKRQRGSAAERDTYSELRARLPRQRIGRPSSQPRILLFESPQMSCPGYPIVRMRSGSPCNRQG